MATCKGAFVILFKDTDNIHCILKSKRRAINYCNKHPQELYWEEFGFLDGWEA